MSASVTIHVVSVLALLILPRVWPDRQEPEPLRMTISFSGSPGERSGGMVAAGAIPIEKVAPPPKRPEPIPPATPPKADAITVPAKAPPKTPPKPSPTSAEPAATPRPDVTGAQVRPGTAVADTRSTAQSTGLTFGGQGAGDTTVELDVTFCCPEYIAELKRRIDVKWVRAQPIAGSTTVVFEIRKDGSFTPPTVVQSGGVFLDNAAKDAFTGLQLQPLPPQFKDDKLKIRLTFPYVR